VEFPTVAVPDGTHLLDVLDFYVGAGFVLCESEGFDRAGDAYLQ